MPGDWGAHGRFDRRARESSVELTLRMHRGWVALAGVGLAGLALGALSRGRSPGRDGGDGGDGGNSGSGGSGGSGDAEARG